MSKEEKQSASHSDSDKGEEKTDASEAGHDWANSEAKDGVAAESKKEERGERTGEGGEGGERGEEGRGEEGAEREERKGKGALRGLEGTVEMEGENAGAVTRRRDEVTGEGEEGAEEERRGGKAEEEEVAESRARREKEIGGATSERGGREVWQSALCALWSRRCGEQGRERSKEKRGGERQDEGEGEQDAILTLAVAVKGSERWSGREGG